MQTSAVAKQARTPARVNGLYTTIFRSIASGDVPLPSLPDLVLRMRSAAGGEASSFVSIARIVKTEPGLASYIMKLSNSPAFRARYPAADLGSAINRLGIETVLNVATSYSLRNLFRSKHVLLRKCLRTLWRDSVRLAATSAVLAAQVTRQNPDRALLAGLLANIGALPLVNAAADRTDIELTPGLLEEIVTAYSSQVGCMMLRNWGLDEELIDVVRSYDSWAAPAIKGKPTLAELVLMCRYLIRSNDGASVPEIDDFPCWFKFQSRFPRARWDASLIRDMSSHVSNTERSLGSP